MARQFSGVTTCRLRNDAWGALDPGGYPFTMSAVVLTGGVTTQEDFFWFGDHTSANNFFVMQLAGATGGDPFRFIHYSTSAASAVTSNSFSALTSHYVCGVATSATDRRAILDGNWASSGTNTTNRAYPTSVTSVCLGQRGDSTPVNFFNGRISECAIWNVALIQKEVESLAAGTSPMMVRPDALIFYAPLISDLTERKSKVILSEGTTATTLISHPKIYYPTNPVLKPTPPEAVNPIILAETGAVTIAGQTVNLQWDKEVDAETGSVAIAGQTVGLIRDSVVIAETGAIAIAGQDVNLVNNSVLAAETGAVDINGQNVTLRLERSVTAETGAVSIAGQDINFKKDSVLIAETGAMAIDGKDAGLSKGFKVTAETGAVDISGQAVNFTRARTLTAETGAAAIDGQDVLLTKGVENELVANTGSFVIAGQPVDLLYSGAGEAGIYPLWRRRGRR